MPTGRQADQMIGADLEGFIIPSAAVPVATYHVKSNQDGSYSLGAGAPNRSDVLYSAGKYLDLTIDITNANGGTLTVTIVGWDPASGKQFTILASAGLVANATTVLKVGPALTAAANLVANDFIPFEWSVQVVVATATMTFSLGGQQMP